MEDRAYNARINLEDKTMADNMTLSDEAMVKKINRRTSEAGQLYFPNENITELSA